MIDEQLKVEILVRVALSDYELASQELVILEDFADSLGIEIDDLILVINKYEKEDNSWQKLKPLFQRINNDIDQFVITDCIKKIIDADFKVTEEEKNIYDNVLALYSSDS